MTKKVPGFSKKQRSWVLERDHYRCSMMIYDHGSSLWSRCPTTTDLQVHHVIPRGWFTKHILPLKSNWDVNGPDNGITLCSTHHIGKQAEKSQSIYIIHPDTEVARLAYSQGDYASFEEMVRNRTVLNENGIPYWNTRWDWLFVRLMKMRNERHDIEYPFAKNRWYTNGVATPSLVG